MRTKQEILKAIDLASGSMREFIESGNYNRAMMLSPMIESLKWVIGEENTFSVLLETCDKIDKAKR